MCCTWCATMSECTVRQSLGVGGVIVVCPTLFKSMYCEDLLLFATVYTHDLSSPCTHVTQINCDGLNVLSKQSDSEHDAARDCVKIIGGETGGLERRFGFYLYLFIYLTEGRVLQLVFEKVGKGFIFCFLTSDL